MSKSYREHLSNIFTLAWQLIKRCGLSRSQALTLAWRNAKLVTRVHAGIVKFYFQKVDGTVREAYGTLKADLMAPTNGAGRRANDSVQVYFDTEKQEYRCFKRANLISIA